MLGFGKKCFHNLGNLITRKFICNVLRNIFSEGGINTPHRINTPKKPRKHMTRSVDAMGNTDPADNEKDLSDIPENIKDVKYREYSVASLFLNKFL